MKCQYCNKNIAENTLRIYMFGGEQEIHLCGECTHRLRQVSRTMDLMPEMPGRAARPLPSTQRENTSANIPHDAGTEIKNRRRLNSLKTRLQKAVEAEKYEEAARLRDEIALQQREEYAYDS